MATVVVPRSATGADVPVDRLLALAGLAFLIAISVFGMLPLIAAASLVLRFIGSSLTGSA